MATEQPPAKKAAAKKSATEAAPAKQPPAKKAAAKKSATEAAPAKQPPAKKAAAKKPTPKAQAHSMLAKSPEECADLVGKSFHWDANGTKMDGVIADVSDMPNHLHVRFWHAGAAAWEEEVTILSKDDFQRITPIAW